jgi:hypothetical protein
MKPKRYNMLEKLREVNEMLFEGVEVGTARERLIGRGDI